MAIDERLRLSIHTQLTELIGSEEATALIEHIMPVPWHDVATKDDLVLVRADIDAVRTELRANIGAVRSELDSVRTELSADIDSVRTEMNAEFAVVRSEIAGVRSDMDVLRADMGRDMADLRSEMHSELGGLRTEMQQGFVAQTRWMTGYVTALGAAMLAVARLLF